MILLPLAALAYLIGGLISGLVWVSMMIGMAMYYLFRAVLKALWKAFGYMRKVRWPS